MQRRATRGDKAPSSQQPDPRRKYSFEDVKDWCERMVESRLRYLHRQVAQNNELIHNLSERLKHAERQLKQKDRLLQQLQQHTQRSTSNKADIIELSNKLLNDKLRERFGEIDRVVQELRENKGMAKGNKGVEGYQVRMEQSINRNVAELKAQLKERCEDIKKANSAYWVKIKDWAKLFEEKLNKCDSNISSLIKSSDLIDESLSTSIMSIYKVKNFTGRAKEIQQAVMDLEESFKLINETQIELKELIDNRVDLSYSKDEFTYRLEDGKIEEELRFVGVTELGTRKKQENKERAYVEEGRGPIKEERNFFKDWKNDTKRDEGERKYDRKYESKYDEKYELKFDFKNDSKDFSKYQFKQDTSKFELSNKSVTQSSTTKFESLPKFETLPTPAPSYLPVPTPPLSLSKTTLLNTTSPLLHLSYTQPLNTSNSIKSLGASRAQQIPELRRRLKTLSEQKKMPLPIPCFLDEISYLKNSYNNYLFDNRGNMFKMKKEEYERLCEEGLLKRV